MAQTVDITAQSGTSNGSSANGASSSSRPLVGEELVTRLAGLVCTAEQRKTRTSYAPFTGGPVGEVPVCVEDDVELAFQRARKAQEAWAKVPVEDRAKVFLRFHDLLLERRDLFCDLIQAETGKARISAFEEFADTAMASRYYGEHGPKFLKPKKRTGAIPGLTAATEYHQPKGVIGVISPWNYPLTLPITDAVPALIAGNGIVLKPDAQTSFIALLGVELLYEAGIPRDLFQVVTGEGKKLGSPMIERADYMMFTGSTATGKIIAKQCADRLIGFSAELGGKNPMIVCADASFKRTVDGAARACFSNSGQLCISVERMYVEDAIYDKFVPAFVDRVKNMELNAEFDFSAEMGSIVSQDQLDVIIDHVEDARSKGAEVLAGGRHRPDIGPLFYEPTVLTGVTEDMKLMREETFGPVVAVSRVSSVDEAIERANDTCYGLNASIWTSDLKKAHEIATRIKAGTVNVNEGYAAAWASHDAPMGGMKDSGVGRRHGEEGILKYTEPQTVAVQKLMPLGPSALVNRDRYVAMMMSGMKAMRRLPFLG